MRQHRDLVLFSCLAAALAAFHALKVREWVRTDVQPPGWDTSVHLGTAMDYRQAWHDRRWLDLLLTKARPGHPRYPPLYGYTAAPLTSLARPQISVAWLDLSYFMALVLSLAWLAFRLGGVWAGLAALLVAGLSPQLLYEYREAFPDVALAPWVALAYVFFIESEACAARGWAAAFGLAAGLAFLSRWSAVIYLFPAFAAALRDRGRRRNLLLALGLAAVVCAPWYLLNFVQMVPQIWVSANIGHEQGLPRVWSWAGWCFYWHELANCYTWPGVLLLLCGTVLAARAGWRKSRWSSPQVLVAAWLGFSLLFLSLVPNKHWRYFLPAAGALPAIGLAGLPAPALPAAGLIALWHARDIRRPDPAAWPLEEIVRTVEARRDRSRGPASLCVLANVRNMNSNNLGFLARRDGLDDVFIGGQETDIPEWSDFVLVKTKDTGVFLGEETLRIVDQAVKGAPPFSLVFQEARRWPLPDGSEAVLYEQKPRPPLIAEPLAIRHARIRSADLDDIRISPLGSGSYGISISTLTLGKLALPIRSVRASVEGARLAEVGGGVRVLDVRKVVVSSAEVRWDEASNGLTSRARVPIILRSEDGAVFAKARAGWFSVEVGVAASVEGGRLRVRGRRLRLAGVPVPGFGLLRWETSLSARLPDQPYDIAVAPVRLSAEGLRIGD